MSFSEYPHVINDENIDGIVAAHLNDVNSASHAAIVAGGIIAGSGGPAAAVVWGDIQNVPETFPPSPHQHAESDVNGLSGSLAAKADLVSGTVPDAQIPARLSDAALSAMYVLRSLLAVANGVATLGSDGKLSVSQMPPGLMQLKGSWDASTNTPALADGTGSVGAYYRVTAAGTQNLGSGSQTFGVGDFIIYNDANVWELSHSGADIVQSVVGLAGAITGPALKAALGAGSASGLATLGVDGKLDPTQIPPGSGGGTGLMARKVWAPSATTSVSSSSGTSSGLLDAANLTVTFVAPASGNVRVTLESLANPNSAGQGYYWNLSTSAVTTGGVPGSERWIGGAPSSTATGGSMRIHVEIFLTGLTVGTSYTYYWRHRGSGQTYFGGASNEFTGGNFGPAVMSVWTE